MRWPAQIRYPVSSGFFYKAGPDPQSQDKRAKIDRQKPGIGLRQGFRLTRQYTHAVHAAKIAAASNRIGHESVAAGASPPRSLSPVIICLTRFCFFLK